MPRRASSRVAPEGRGVGWLNRVGGEITRSLTLARSSSLSYTRARAPRKAVHSARTSTKEKSSQPRQFPVRPGARMPRELKPHPPLPPTPAGPRRRRRDDATAAASGDCRCRPRSSRARAIAAVQRQARREQVPQEALEPPDRTRERPGRRRLRGRRGERAARQGVRDRSRRGTSYMLYRYIVYIYILYICYMYLGRYMYIKMHVSVYVYVHVYMYMYICMCMC